MKEKELVSFGKTIKYYRTQLNISQEELSFRSRLHKNYIGQIERGERNPALINILKLSKGLGLTVGELMKTFELIHEEEN